MNNHEHYYYGVELHVIDIDWLPMRCAVWSSKQDRRLDVTCSEGICGPSDSSRRTSAVESLAIPLWIESG